MGHTSITHPTLDGYGQVTNTLLRNFGTSFEVGTQNYRHSHRHPTLTPYIIPTLLLLLAVQTDAHECILDTITRPRILSRANPQGLYVFNAAKLEQTVYNLLLSLLEVSHSHMQ